jgi:hypothetical protein
VIATNTRFAVSGLTIVLLLAIALRWGDSMPLAVAGLVVLIVAIPQWFVLASLSAVRMAHQGALMERPVWWLWLGHPVRCGLAILPALATGAAVAAALIGQGAVALGWIVATAIVLWIISGSSPLLRTAARFRPYARIKPVVLVSAATAALVMSVAATLFVALPGDVALADIVAAAPRYAGSSVVVAQMMDTVALWSGVQVWGAGLAADQAVPAWLILLWRVAASFGFFAGVALTMAFGLLPGAALRRILLPTDAEVPAPVTAGKLALWTAVAAVAVVIFFQTLAGLEAALTALTGPVQITAAEMSPPSENPAPGLQGPIADAVARPPEPLPLSPAGIRRMVEAETVGPLQCPPGTIAAIEALDAEFASILATQQDNLTHSLAAGFDGLRGNVPVFLDWYYSLEAEYLRMANLLVGSGLSYLDAQLQSQLGANGPFDALDTALAALAGNGVLAESFRALREARLAGCALTLPQDDVTVIATDRRPDTLLFSDLSVAAINLETRIATSGMGGLAAGAITGVIMAKVGAKMVAKGIFAAAADALVKIAGSKALSLGSGMLIGAGTGAAGGSVVPGAGTTAGAIIGGLAGGLAVMVGVDFTLLKLDEAVSRTQFEAEIMAAIDAAEDEMRQELGLSLRAPSDN